MLEPLVGTPARDDVDHIKVNQAPGDLTGLRWWAHRAAILNVSAAEEHLEGIRAVLNADKLLPLPAMALARSVYEAVISTCWLVDADATTEQRLARWAGRLLHDGQEPTTALASFGEIVVAQTERERVVGARSLGQDLMTKAGFELEAKPRDKSEETGRVTYQGASSGLTPNVTKLVERFTPNENLWHMFSGATHSRGWLVNGLEGPESEVITSIISPLLDTSDALAVEVARYFGLNPRQTVRRTHMHRIALLKHARPNDGPVASVDAYRAAGGASRLPSS